MIEGGKPCSINIYIYIHVFPSYEFISMICENCENQGISLAYMYSDYTWHMYITSIDIYIYIHIVWIGYMNGTFMAPGEGLFRWLRKSGPGWFIYPFSRWVWHLAPPKRWHGTVCQLRFTFVAFRWANPWFKQHFVGCVLVMDQWWEATWLVVSISISSPNHLVMCCSNIDNIGEWKFDMHFNVMFHPWLGCILLLVWSILAYVGD